MRTTVVLDDQLVAEAREVFRGQSLRAILETSLREAIKARQREALRQAIGTMELAITEEELQRLRRDKPLEPLWQIGGTEAPTGAAAAPRREGAHAEPAGVGE